MKLLERLVSDIETRDPYLHGHSRRVARHSWMIARRMGLPRTEVARVRTAAAIHDVGKIKTPKAILHKPDRLTDEEYEIVKLHPGEGGQMASALGDEQLASIVRHHHERIDGSGYPDGLSGADIPLGARIIAVADTFDAITSTRAYRAARPHKAAIDILRGEAGTRLDPVVVKAFCVYYAGRRPLAVWAFIASLPERVVSLAGWKPRRRGIGGQDRRRHRSARRRSRHNLHARDADQRTAPGGGGPRRYGPPDAGRQRLAGRPRPAELRVGWSRPQRERLAPRPRRRHLARLRARRRDGRRRRSPGRAGRRGGSSTGARRRRPRRRRRRSRRRRQAPPAGRRRLR